MAFEEVSNYINQIRRDFAQQALDETQADKNPFEQLAKWMEEAINGQILDPYAMVISTVNAQQKPTSRVVYLRGIYQDGLAFYTNYHSNKGHDLSKNPHIAVNFFWAELERQIRIEGEVKKLSSAQSDEYFNARPRESQIGAWASSQSESIANRQTLEQKFASFEQQFANQTIIPRPPHWGGYLIVPNYFEFWQGRPNRLHDRIFYKKNNENWSLGRLMP